METVYYFVSIDTLTVEIMHGFGGFSARGLQYRRASHKTGHKWRESSLCTLWMGLNFLRPMI